MSVKINGEIVDRELPPIPELTPEEIALETESQEKATCDLIDEAIEHYITHRLNSAGVIMVERMLKYDPPNANAVKVNDWVEGVSMEAELRKALVYAELWPDDQDPCDFSIFGEKPRTAAQLLAEYTGLP